MIDDKERVDKGLKDFIQYATNTKKFQDVGFYETVQRYIAELEADRDSLQILEKAQQNVIWRLKMDLTGFDKNMTKLEAENKHYREALDRIEDITIQMPVLKIIHQVIPENANG